MFLKKTLFTTFALIGITSSSLLAQNPGCDGARYLNDVFPTVKKTTINYAPTLNHLNFIKQ